MFLYDDELGGCLAVNRNHPEERRRWSLAHGYAHFLVHRYHPAAYLEGSYQREQFADHFAKQLRYQYLAVEAFKEEKISEGMLAKFLRVDRLEARNLVRLLSEHTSDVTDEELVDLDLEEQIEL